MLVIALIMNTDSEFSHSLKYIPREHLRVRAKSDLALHRNDPSVMLVRLGEWNAQNMNEPYPSINVNVAKITIHPSFNPNTLENDVAVVRFNGLVPISSYPNINTACKPSMPPMAGTKYATSTANAIFY
jgi:hypothetical protein